MRVVVALTGAGLFALVVALITGSTWPAVLVVALAAAGIVLLLRDWRHARAEPATPRFEETGDGTALRPDEFAPDISTGPGGPSSDARSDQV